MQFKLLSIFNFPSKKFKNLFQKICHLYHGIVTKRKQQEDCARYQYLTLQWTPQSQSNHRRLKWIFTKQCAVTGGGTPPSPPPTLDGDEYEDNVQG